MKTLYSILLTINAVSTLSSQGAVTTQWTQNPINELFVQAVPESDESYFLFESSNAGIADRFTIRFSNNFRLIEAHTPSGWSLQQEEDVTQSLGIASYHFQGYHQQNPNEFYDLSAGVSFEFQFQQVSGTPSTSVPFRLEQDITVYLPSVGLLSSFSQQDLSASVVPESSVTTLVFLSLLFVRRERNGRVTQTRPLRATDLPHRRNRKRPIHAGW